MHIEDKGEKGKGYAKAESSDRRECLWISAVAGTLGDYSSFRTCTYISCRVEVAPNGSVWQAIGLRSLRGDWGAYLTRGYNVTGIWRKAGDATCARFLCH